MCCKGVLPDIPCQVEPMCKGAPADPEDCIAQSALVDLYICPGRHVSGDVYKHVAETMHARLKAHIVSDSAPWA